MPGRARAGDGECVGSRGEGLHAHDVRHAASRVPAGAKHIKNNETLKSVEISVLLCQNIWLPRNMRQDHHLDRSHAEEHTCIDDAQK